MNSGLPLILQFQKSQIVQNKGCTRKYPLFCTKSVQKSILFSGDKIRNGHFQGMVSNVFMRKSAIARRKRGLTTILNNFRFKPEVDRLGK